MADHSPRPDVSADTVLEIVRGMLSELRPRQASIPSVTLDSAFEREVGFDSLARVELLTRIERAFDVKLPEAVLGSAETPRDVLRAVLAAKHVRRPEAYETARHAAPAPVEQAPDSAETLLDALEWHVRAHPERIHIMLESGEGEETRISYADLYRQAMAIAVGLLDSGLRPGGAVAIMLPTCPAYFFSFIGVLLAGGVPVPIYPPVRASQIGFTFVAKRELREQFISRAYLSSIGAEFVDRADPYKDADRVVSLMLAGRSVVFFPEGTFQRRPGLQAFHIGAFVAAARAGVPVVPVTLHGTRSALRDGQWFPRRDPIRVAIGAPIWPEGEDWSATLRLRDTARATILQLCGEPDAADEATPEDRQA